LTPATDTNPIGTPHTVTATLTDAAGMPVPSAPLSFLVTGVNPGTGAGTTNASGQATFTYTGTNGGQDQISACYDVDSTPPCEAIASATKDWTASDLRISKSGPANALVGGLISYTLTVTNDGPSSATNVVVSDPVPAGTSFVSATPSQGSCDSTVSCNLGAVATGNNATVTIVVRANAAGTVTNTASVSGPPDPDTSNNSATATTNVFGFAPGGGSFVIGDGNSANGTAVTFWGAQWSKLNDLSAGSAPASFKGFAVDPATPSCGTGWSSDPGNSAPPPAGPLPAFIAVIVTSSASKSGSQISGDTAHIVLVQTDPGYASNPGHAGTGTVVAQIC
jgi:uncharacterized repeat protein (TIGR01451 family)